MHAVLVTGGAGYIGSHVAKALSARGLLPITFDDLTHGFHDAVRWGPLVRGDIRDTDAVFHALATHDCSAVVHCAGLIEVGRSVSDPDKFWDINVGGTAKLLLAMRAAGVGRLVFSSSAAVYEGDTTPIRESAPKTPASPYGDTKLAGETMIAAQCRATGMSAVALRYFNAAGADTSGEIGEAHEPETHLIPLAVAAVLTHRPLSIFGDDHPTPDGTCVRDFVHVSDLAAAHVAAVEAQLLQPGCFEAVNLGTGNGSSVLDIIEAVSAAMGRMVPISIKPRRAGDPASLVADVAKAEYLLGWRAGADLQRIVADAVQWASSPAYGAR